MDKKHSSLKLFVSYSRENRDVIQKILSFADYLRGYGIEPVLDEIFYHQIPSPNSIQFMTDNLLNHEKVIVILSKLYKEKADKNEGGVGLEYSIIKDDYKKNPNKYIFVYMCDGMNVPYGVYKQVVPTELDGVAVHVLNNDNDSLMNIIMLLQEKDYYKLRPVSPSIDFTLPNNPNELDSKPIISFFEATQNKRAKAYDFTNLLFHSILTIEENDEDFSYEVYKCIQVTALRIPEFKMTPQFEDRSVARLSSNLVKLPSIVEMNEENEIVFQYPIPIDNKMGDIIPMHYKMELVGHKGAYRHWDMYSENDSFVEIHDFVTKYQNSAPNGILYKKRIPNGLERPIWKKRM